MTALDIVNLLKDKGQVFLTGAGGVGKTYTAKEIIRYFSNVLKLATTQLAAQNLEGETLHSVFKLGLSKDLQDLEAYDRDCVRNLLNKGLPFAKALDIRLKPLRELLSVTELIIIDEVSMMSAQLLDLIYARLTLLGFTYIPILFIGDLFQLPPVCRDNDRVKAEYVFKSQYWHPVVIELTKIQRTADIEFAYYQQLIRQGLYTEKTHNFLNKLLANTPQDYAEWKPTILCATNAEVESINKQELDKLKSKLVVFKGEYTNNTNLRDCKDFPTEINLALKVGARVIFCQNNSNVGYYNGLQGVIKHIGKDTLTIDTYDNQTLEVSKVKFTRYHSEVISGVSTHIVDHELIQFPVRVAYAITIHKSQGMTIDHLWIKFDRIFSAGQAYVAISRASNTKYLRLDNLRPEHLRIKNTQVLDYLQSQAIIKLEQLEFNREVISV